MRWAVLGAAVLVGAACAGGAPNVADGGGGPRWAPGRYLLQASFMTRQDTEHFTHSEQVDVRAEFTVASNGTLALQSSEGICRRSERDQRDRLRERARGSAIFRCGQSAFELRPAAGTVRGTVRASVPERYRIRGPCETWTTNADGQRTCSRYSWIIQPRRSAKSASLRVQRVRDAGG